jgi:hypothetical protein
MPVKQNQCFKYKTMLYTKIIINLSFYGSQRWLKEDQRKARKKNCRRNPCLKAFISDKYEI